MIDLLGKIGSFDYDMRIMYGLRKTLPLDVVEPLKYDLSGRLMEIIDALGHVTGTLYLVELSTNKVQSTNSIGYTTQQS
jgi:YD repeat-containing protein